MSAETTTLPAKAHSAPRKYSRDDLVHLATRGPTIGIRESAADALYHLGRIDGARAVSDAIAVKS